MLVIASGYMLYKEKKVCRSAAGHNQTNVFIN
jgi:hypothetical protein